MPQQWGLDRQPDGWAPSQVRSDDWEPKSEPGPCADTTDLIRCLVGECEQGRGHGDAERFVGPFWTAAIFRAPPSELPKGARQKQHNSTSQSGPDC